MTATPLRDALVPRLVSGGLRGLLNSATPTALEALLVASCVRGVQEDLQDRGGLLNRCGLVVRDNASLYACSNFERSIKTGVTGIAPQDLGQLTTLLVVYNENIEEVFCNFVFPAFKTSNAARTVEFA